MEDLHIKQVDGKTKRLRFTTVKQREAATTADVFRKSKGDRLRVHQQSSSIAKLKTKDDDFSQNSSSSFQSEIDLIQEKNATDQFNYFYRKCWPFCRSLVELLHYKDQVIELFVTNLSLKAKLCTAETLIDLLHLLGVLARDLRGEIVNDKLHSIIRVVLGLVDPMSPRTSESVFQCLSYLFLYCVNGDPNLDETTNEKKNFEFLDEMRSYFGPMFGHKKEFVRRLAAESFASLFRKCRKKKLRKIHVRKVMKSFLTAAGRCCDQTKKNVDIENTIDGLSLYLFYTIRGIPGQLNSRGFELIQIVMELLSDKKIMNDQHENTFQSILSSFLQYVAKHLKVETFYTIWEEISKEVQKIVCEKSIDRNYFLVLRALLNVSQSVVSSVRKECNDTEATILSNMVGFVLRSECYNSLLHNEKEAVLGLLFSSWKVYGNNTAFSSRLSQYFCTMMGSKDNLAEIMLGETLLPMLPHKMAMQSLAPALLMAAGKNSALNKELALSLVHAVAISLPDNSDSDDIVFEENAKACLIEEECRQLLLDLCLSYERCHDLARLTYIADCLLFLVLNDSDDHLQKDKKALIWLLNEMVYMKDISNCEGKRVAEGVLLESFARIASKFLSSRHNVHRGEVIKLLKEVKPRAETLLRENRDSVAILRGVAFLAKTLSLESILLSQDVDGIFDALLLNLRSPNHFIRLHTLVILESFPPKPFIIDHAELDLTDDLDEEPSVSSITNTKKLGPSASLTGSCHLLKNLLNIESTDISFHNERAFISEINRVEVLARSGKIPVVYAEAAANVLFSTFNMKFSPVWNVSKKALIALADKYEDFASSSLMSNIERVMKYEKPALDTQDKYERGDGRSIMERLFYYRVQWDSSLGEKSALFESVVERSKLQGRISWFQHTDLGTNFKLVFEVAEAVPQLTMKKSRIIVRLFLSFLNEQYFFSAFEGDPDKLELSLDEFTSEVGNRNLSRGVASSRLLSFLKVFSAIQSPKQLYKNVLLQKIFRGFLANPEASIAQSAFSCLCNFKLPYIVPYNDQIKRLLTKGELRQTLAKFNISTKGKIDIQHRPQIVPIITRILFGRLIARSIKGSKDSPQARRGAIVSFLSGLDYTKGELDTLIFMMCRSFVPSNINFNKEEGDYAHLCFDTFRENLDFSYMITIHPQRRLGFLNLLASCVSHLGHNLHQYLPILIEITLTMLKAIESQKRKETELKRMGNEAEAIEDTQQRNQNTRTLCLNVLADIFAKYSSVFSFQEYSDRLWTCLRDVVSKLPLMVINSNNKPSILKFIHVLSSHHTQISILPNEAVVAIVKCLSRRSKTHVIECVTDILENLLTQEKSISDDVETPGIKLIRNNLDLIIDRFAERLGVVENLAGEEHVKLSTSSSADNHPFSSSLNKELSILCRISELFVLEKGSSDTLSSKKAEQLGSLSTLLLPFLSANNKIHDATKADVLAIINCFVPMMNKDKASALIPTISSLLGPEKSRPGVTNPTIRSLLVKVYTSIVSGEDGSSLRIKVGDALVNLNSMSTKRLDEYDFERILPALTGLGGESEGSWRSLSKLDEDFDATKLSPLLNQCFYFLHDSDGVISRGAFKALKSFILTSAEQYHNQKSWLAETKSHFLSSIKDGFLAKKDSVRRLFISLLAEVSRKFIDLDSPDFYSDLNQLTRDDDMEQDFFVNVAHLQIHRRARALNKLRKVINEVHENDQREHSNCPFSSRTLSNVLLPLAIHPLFECTKSSEESYAFEAIATVGAIARHLSWSKYQNTIMSFLAHLPRYAGQERYLLGAICAVLDSFHFDTSTRSNMLPMDKQEIVYDKIGAEETENVILRSLMLRIIPKVERYLLKEEVDKSGSRFKSVRPPIAIALLKVLQKLPTSTFNIKLPNLILTICGVLKSKDSSAREAARKTLCKIAVSLGDNYLPHILREITVSLSEGYQLHVRASIVHSLLLSFADARKNAALPSTSEAFARCVPAFMNLLQEDIFGIASEMKAAESNRKSKMKEAMGAKSYESIEILSSLVMFKPSQMKGWDGKGTPPSSIHIICQPLLERMRSPAVSKSTISKVKECLGRIVIGVQRNGSATAEEVLPFVQAIFPTLNNSSMKDDADEGEDEDENEDHITISNGKKVQNRYKSSKNKFKSSVSSWLPSTNDCVFDSKEAFSVKERNAKNALRVQDGNSAPKLTGNNRYGASAISSINLNDPTQASVVVFGLKLLHSSLKRSKLDWDEKRVRDMADPLVPILIGCVRDSSENESILLCLRCIPFFLRWDLPSVQKFGADLGPVILNLLMVMGADSRNEVTQGCFKILAFILYWDVRTDSSKNKEGKHDKLPLTNKQMDALVSLLHSAISDISPHNSALSLIKSIVSRTYLSPDMYDIMEGVLKLNVQSQVDGVRRQCGQIFLMFLLSYPLSVKRRSQHLHQIVANIKYQYESGRISALELMSDVLRKFPINLLEEHSQLCFLPLVVQLVNDDSKKCKELISTTIGIIINRVSTERLKSFYDFITKWFGGVESLDNLALQRVAAQLIGLMFDFRVDFIEKKEISRTLVDSMTCKIGREVAVNSSVILKDERWQILYFCLVCFEKANVANLKYFVDSLSLWALVIKSLINPHPWIQQVALRTVTVFLTHLEPTDLLSSDNPHLFFVKRKGLLYEVARNVCHQINSNEQEQNLNLSISVTKILSWLVQAMDNFPELCYEDEFADSKDQKDPILWLFKRLSNIAKSKGLQRRESVFKCFAAFSTICRSEILTKHLTLILEPMHRALTEGENEDSSKRKKKADIDHCDFIKEVMELLENRCGTEKFICAYSIVKIQASEKRDRRKQEINAEAVADPQRAAARKIKKHEGDKRRKRRRMKENLDRGTIKRRAME